MKLVIIAGPNGAGKSTAAPRLLRGALGVERFVNADTVARGLDAFQPERVAFTAGRVMLERLRELSGSGTDFAFETTLASRTFAPWVRHLKQQGYELHLVFLHLPSSEMAVSRVADRVRLGGHDVPKATIRRRYIRSLNNFFALYRPLADSWWFYENSRETPDLLACGFLTHEGETRELIIDPSTWQGLQETYT
ncbi:MAG: AAA family ATPase [Pseudomonadota bacterium]